MIRASEALKRLKEGNQRFRSNDNAFNATDSFSRTELVSAQTPFAIILGCSDSRVPAELVFGQGLGDLFVIRVAGNIVAPSQIGSIEFAAEKFETRLVVVLGHSHCGAVEATLEQLDQPSENRSPNLRAIVDRITPAVEPVRKSHSHTDDEDLLNLAVRANILASVENLCHGSEILEALVADEGLMIVGAEYCLKSGEVQFFQD